MVVLVLFIMCHVFSKCLGLALLWATFGAGAASSFFVADFSLYCIIKALQGDFLYWLHDDSIFISIILSVAMRFAMKVMAEFSGFVQNRQ